MPVLVSVRLDDQDLREFVAVTLDRIEDREALHRDLGEHLLISVEDRFETETDPDGEKWEPLSPATIASAFRRRHRGKKATKRAKGGGRTETAAARRFAERKKILFLEGALRGGITYRATEDELQVGSVLKYARIHQLGGEAGRKGSRVTIPARRYLGLSEADRRAFAEILTRHLRPA